MVQPPPPCASGAMNPKSSTWNCVQLLWGWPGNCVPHAKMSHGLLLSSQRVSVSKEPLVKAQKDLGLIGVNPSEVPLLHLGSWTSNEGSSSFHHQAWGTFRCWLFPLIAVFCMIPTFHWPSVLVETWVFQSTFLHKQVSDRRPILSFTDSVIFLAGQRASWPADLVILASKRAGLTGRQQPLYKCYKMNYTLQQPLTSLVLLRPEVSARYLY